MTTARTPEEIEDDSPVQKPAPERDKRNSLRPNGGVWGSDGIPNTAEHKAITVAEPDEDGTVGTQGGVWGSDGIPSTVKRSTPSSPGRTDSEPEPH